MKQGETTEVFSTGKVDFTLYPEIYTKFVSELHNHHQDLLAAMTMAQVQMKDGSAFDFLNTFLGTKVTVDMPMEVGFAQLLDALKMRAINGHSQAAIERVAKQFKNHSLFPARSDPSKPLFPDEADQ